MPHTHHTHSGQFCAHATSTLESVIQTAIAQGITTLCTTEHIPRSSIDFYDEEVAENYTEEHLTNLFAAYHAEALRLRDKYSGQIKIFVGFEGEWIRPSTSTDIEELLTKYEFDLFVGSVHHMHTIPIDIDVARYDLAKGHSGGTDEGLFLEYFVAQYEMLTCLKPPLVGHFDLIRLKSPDPDVDFRSLPAVWLQILKNLEYIMSYGGVLEINSAAIRKGMREPYPQVAILKSFDGMGGRCALSDDSHGVEQVGLNYGRVLECVRSAGIEGLWHLSTVGQGVERADSRFPRVGWRSVAIEEMEKHAFFTKQNSPAG